MTEISNKGFKKLVLSFLKCGISSEQLAKDLSLTQEQLYDMLKGVPISPGKHSTMQLADSEERYEENP